MTAQDAPNAALAHPVAIVATLLARAHLRRLLRLKGLDRQREDEALLVSEVRTCERPDPEKTQ